MNDNFEVTFCGNGGSTAREIHDRLNAANLLALNLIGASGCGKTELIQRTVTMSSDRPSHHRCAVLVSEPHSAHDAERLARCAETAPVSVGNRCHLAAPAVALGLDRLNLHHLSVLFIENTGGMACSVQEDLGEHLRVVLLSLPEGENKLMKYPALFRTADAVLLTKIDLQSTIPFDVECTRRHLSQLGSRAPLFTVSALTGQGMDDWCSWLEMCRNNLLL